MWSEGANERAKRASERAIYVTTSTHSCKLSNYKRASRSLLKQVYVQCSKRYKYKGLSTFSPELATYKNMFFEREARFRNPKVSLALRFPRFREVSTNSASFKKYQKTLENVVPERFWREPKTLFF